MIRPITRLSGKYAPKVHICAYNSGMDEKLKKAFSSFRHEPERDLSENIWRAIITREQRLARLRLWIFSLIGLTSLTGFVFVSKALVGDLVQSSFYEYLSLAFSNIGSVSFMWRELSLTLAESLPMVSIILSLTLVLVFLSSMRLTIRQISRDQLSLA